MSTIEDTDARSVYWLNYTLFNKKKENIMKIKNVKNAENKVTSTQAISSHFIEKYRSVTIRTFSDFTDKQFIIKEKCSSEEAKKKFLRALKKRKFLSDNYLNAAENIEMSLTYFPVFKLRIQDYMYKFNYHKEIKKPSGLKIEAKYDDSDFNNKLKLSATTLYKTVGYSSEDGCIYKKINKNIHITDFSTKMNRFFSCTRQDGVIVDETNADTEILVSQYANEDNIVLKALSMYFDCNVNAANYNILQIVYYPVWKCCVQFENEEYVSYVSDCNDKSILSLAFDANLIESTKRYYEKIQKVFEWLGNRFFYLWSFVLCLLPIGIICAIMPSVFPETEKLFDYSYIIFAMVGGVLFHWIIYYITAKICDNALFFEPSKPVNNKVYRYLKDTKVKLKVLCALFIFSFFMPVVLLAIAILIF